MSVQNNWIDNPSYKLSMNILKALGGNTDVPYESADEIWDEINKIYDSLGDGFTVDPIVLEVIENGKYEYLPTESVDAYAPVKIDVNIDTQSFYDNGYEAGSIEQKSKMTSIEITESGIYEREDGYNVVDVNIPMQEKSVSYSTAGNYEVSPDNGYKGLTKVNVEVSLEGKTQIPNGFRFTGGDMSLIEWDKYDWSMVYDTSNFFDKCTATDPSWVTRFANGFNGELYSGYNMFANFQAESLDLSGWDVSKMTDMGYMFYFNPNLINLDVSNWDTSKVTDMNNMFSSCGKLTSLDVSNWDTSKVTDMNSMFHSCNKLTSLDVSNWDTSKVTNVTNMFYNCYNLASLDVSNWDTSKVINMGSMFMYCSNLISLDISNWDTSKVINMGSMFSSCASLIDVNMSGCNTPKLTDIHNMFTASNNLTSIDIRNFDLSQVTRIEYFLPSQSGNQLSNLKFGKNLKINWTGTGSPATNTQLKKESLLSIIDGLYDFKGNGESTTRSCQFGSTNLAKLTEDEIALATAKGWTLTT